MGRLPAAKWNPAEVLDVFTDNNDIACAGITQKGLPCGYHLNGEDKQQARRLLASMSQLSLREALDDLPQLARLCLCQKNHQKQATNVVAQWTDSIETYADSLQSARGNAQAARRAQPTVDEIIAELAALSVRKNELTAMLRDANLDDDASARTTPSQSTAAELSESESSVVGRGQMRDSPASRDGWKRVFGRGKQPN